MVMFGYFSLNKFFSLSKKSNFSYRLNLYEYTSQPCSGLQISSYFCSDGELNILFFCHSYAIGGLSGGEDKNSFWRVVAQCTAALPEDKPRYVMVKILKSTNILFLVKYSNVIVILQLSLVLLSGSWLST
jgi:hypothetical protein